MRPLNIRERILLAVLAPATLVAVLVTGTLIFDQLQQERIDQHRRLFAVARQMAAVAEYNIFTGNREALQRLLQASLGEADIVAAAFLDTNADVLATTLPADQLPALAQTIEGFNPSDNRISDKAHWHRLPIIAANLGEFDLYSSGREAQSKLLGHLLMQVSARSLQDLVAGYALKVALIAALVLLAGLALAFMLSRNLIQLLQRISHVVEQVGHGVGGARINRSGGDELGHLAEGIDRMIDRVEINQAELAARVAEATILLRHERDEAEAAAEARSRFFAAASHDLRQPAQALGLFVARLERDAASTPLQPQLQKLGQTVGNLRKLLDTLLDYSRLDGQVVRVEPRPVAATQVINEVVDSFAGTAAAKQLSLRTRIADCWLMTDRALLHRILINLIGNAIQHTQRGGVLVSCRRRGQQACIEIWDTGPGIPPEFQEAVFEELFQLDNPERAAEKGLGLGLAIVRRGAELLHHPLALRSRVGRGSRFGLHVPLTAAPPHDTAARDPGGDKDIPVLLCGLPPAAQQELAALLESWEFAVDHVANTDAARAWILVNGAPRLVIIDAPAGAADVQDGQIWLDRLAAETAIALPALFITGGPLPPLAARPDSMPRLLLARPYRPARLRALLAGMLSHARENTD